MSNLRPALAYTAPSDREGSDDYLVSHGFFRWDDSTETEVDLARSPDERPVLCRQLAWAEVTDAEAHGEERRLQMPQAFILESFSILGPDLPWQAAVVGLILERVGSVRVIADSELNVKSWFERQMSGDGWKSIYPRMDRLRDVDHLRGALGPHAPSEMMRWLPTSAIRDWCRAGEQARALRNDRGKSFGAIADSLAAAGYMNRNGRVTWYPELARKAYEDTGEQW
ncbi:hypothetical protein [Knoellia aerolata]|uniref:Uncharacterized protein n=1 Tax=Knoellia aerolata DSM 18566 TaxID=1385519 RepID=A0A0A0JW95_9MICO|nr:hypothetical protein [Knoellia aerolata]KGN39886.1 hypothetical protein N801_18205 [Knoellia aerolata DSM 18566]